jgi:hypothetical protein
MKICFLKHCAKLEYILGWRRWFMKIVA